MRGTDWLGGAQVARLGRCLMEARLTGTQASGDEGREAQRRRQAEDQLQHAIVQHTVYVIQIDGSAFCRRTPEHVWPRGSVNEGLMVGAGLCVLGWRVVWRSWPRWRPRRGHRSRHSDPPTCRHDRRPKVRQGTGDD